jgi:DNA-binding MarR family transcriptional regulator
VTARNITGLVGTLERDGLAERLPRPRTGGPPLARLTPAGDRLAGELLTEQRAELLAELPEADQRHLLQALASLRAVLARHLGL